MDILFIGGTGRLSKDVAELALKHGHNVYLFTRGSKARKRYVNDSYKMIFGDIYDEKEARERLASYQFDVVLDFLSYSVVQLKSKLNILEGKYRQYFFISSATVYKKESEEEIITESKTKRGNELWKYAYDKYLCEEYLKEYFEGKSAYYTIVRPYVTYGNTRFPYPIIPQNSLLEWTLVDRIQKGMPIPTFDNGKTLTTLTHTEDFAIGVVGLINNEMAYNEDFHITNNEQVTWGQVIDIIGKKVGVKSNVINLSKEQIYNHMVEYREILLGDKGNVMRFSNDKIKKAVPDFAGKITLESGLNETVEFYLQNPEIQKIDYLWNGRVDRMLKRCGIKVSPNYEFGGWKDRTLYYLGRSKMAYSTCVFLTACARRAKRILIHR